MILNSDNRNYNRYQPDQEEERSRKIEILLSLDDPDDSVDVNDMCNEG